MGISVVITTYNEEKRILEVLSAVSKAGGIAEVIVVDDGSDANSKRYLKSAAEKYPHFRFINNPKNLGKAGGLLAGVKAAGNEHIFMLDADLKGLTPEHVSGMIEAYWENRPDLLLSERKNAGFFYVRSGIETAFTGDRIVSKKLLNRHKSLFLQPGYLFEGAMNKIFFRDYTVCKHAWRGVSQYYKPQKSGIKGLVKDIKMVLNIIGWMGLREFLWQMKQARRFRFI